MAQIKSYDPRVILKARRATEFKPNPGGFNFDGATGATGGKFETVADALNKMGAGQNEENGEATTSEHSNEDDEEYYEDSYEVPYEE